jgi:hypothetical protein
MPTLFSPSQKNIKKGEKILTAEITFQFVNYTLIIAWKKNANKISNLGELGYTMHDIQN